MCVLRLAVIPVVSVVVSTVHAQFPPPPGSWEPGPPPAIMITPDDPYILAGQRITFQAMGADTDLFMPGETPGMDEVDVNSAQWTASAGTPTEGSGSTFTWTAPDSLNWAAISVSAPDMGNLADDPDDAEDTSGATLIVPTVIRVYFVDYRMRDSDFAETDDDHHWDCDGWYWGDLVDVPQYDVTVTPARDEPVYMAGGDGCSTWLTLRCSPTVHFGCDIDLETDWGSLGGSATVEAYEQGTPAWGSFEPRPQQVDKFIDQQIGWSYRVPTGSNNWIAMNTTTHDIYQSYDYPCGDPLPKAPRLRVSSVCSAAEDEDTIEDIADELTGWTRDGLNGLIDHGLDPNVDPWCYFDSGADPLECDDQAEVACHVLALVGVGGDLVFVRASTDRLNCLDLEERYCPEHGWDEKLVLMAGCVNNFEGCCRVEDGELTILYAIWSTEPSVVKAKETDVTNNPPHDTNAAALSMLNKLTGFTQAWVRKQPPCYVLHGDVPKPPVD